MVRQERLVHRSEGGRINEKEVGLLTHTVKPNRNQHPVVFSPTGGVGKEVHLRHVVVLKVVDLMGQVDFVVWCCSVLGNTSQEKTFLSGIARIGVRVLPIFFSNFFWPFSTV